MKPIIIGSIIVKEALGGNAEIGAVHKGSPTLVIEHADIDDAIEALHRFKKEVRR